MNTLYEVIGTREEGERVRLFLKLHEPVKIQDSPESIMGDMMGFVNKMKLDAIKTTNPEQLTVSKELWSSHKWNIGDLVAIEVVGEDKNENV